MAENSRPKYQMTVKQEGNELGKMKLEIFDDVAPKHAKNFDKLVEKGKYDGTAFHRVIPGFMIQGGDPNSIDGPRNTWGYGKPGQKKVKAEFNDIKHERGILSAARSQDPNSASSQFFICVADAPHLDGQYTVYGKVIENVDLVDTIVSAERDGRDNPLEKIEMEIKKIEE